MRIRLFRIFQALLLIACASLALISTAHAASPALPIRFEENRGQAAPDVAFVSRTPQYSVLLKQRGILVLTRDGHAVTVDFANSRNTAPLGTDRMLAKTNYLMGADPARWRNGIANYERVTYPQAYPGIDLVWHGTDAQVEHDFEVAPGADPGQIRLEFSGAVLQVNSEGDLTAGDLRFHKPRAFQAGHEVECRYQLRGQDVRFVLGSYDHSQGLTIDPVLSFSSIFGGLSNSYFTNGVAGTALDRAGNVFIVGTTDVFDWPTTGDAFQPVKPGGACYTAISVLPCPSIFIAKFSSDGSTLLSSTYLGGPGITSVSAIAVGANGNLYVSGSISGTDFPKLLPLPGFEITRSGDFIAQLSADASMLNYATALPFGVSGIAVDSAGAVYLAGSNGVTKLDRTGSRIVYSTNQSSGGFSPRAIAVDAIGRAFVTGGCASLITVLDPEGTQLVWSIYLGPDTVAHIGCSVGNSIAVDPAGNVHIAGSTLRTISGARDGFVAKLKGDGSAVIFEKVFGSSNDYVATDDAGNTYIAGTTGGDSPFQIVDPVQEAPSGTLYGPFAARFDGQNGVLEFSTFLPVQGGPIRGLAVDGASGNMYIVGQTSSPDFPLKNPWLGFVAPADQHPFVMKISRIGISSNATLPGGTIGKFYSQVLAATAGKEPYTWSLVSGALPSGLSLSSAGAITGVPMAPGTASFTIAVADTAAATTSLSFSLTIDPVSSPSVSFTASPNPVMLAAGTSFGKTTLSWNVPGVSVVQIWAARNLFATVPGTGSIETGNWVSDGMIFSLVNPASGQTLSTVAVYTAAAGQVSFTASPNPVILPAGTSFGKTTLGWNVPGVNVVQIWAGRNLFATVPGTGSIETGNWVSDGMIFSLVNPANGQTLATVAVYTAATDRVSFTASPNPVILAAGTSFGKTTLGWNVPGVSVLQIQAGGNLFATVPGTGSIETGNWVSDGMIFSLVNPASGQTLSTVVAHTAAAGQVTFTASPNPVILALGRKTTLIWNVPGASVVQIWAGGNLFATVPGTGSIETGAWVSDGMIFSLVDPASGQSLSTVVARTVAAGPITFTANPNPVILEPGGCCGITTLSWNVPGANVVQIWVEGHVFATVPGTGSIATGNWARDGMIFALINPASGQTLASLTINAHR